MRKSAERALRGSESLYRSIVAGAWEGIWLLGASVEQLQGASLQEFLESSLRSELRVSGPW
ncbi:MAG: hypothetical protein ACKOEO_17710 [Planctomycetaceae bacterium]